MLVERTVAPDVADRLVARASALRVGHGLDSGVQVGPLIDGAAVAKAARHIADTAERGAVLACGVAPPDGLDARRYVAPAVLTEVPDGALVEQEETFGPLVPSAAFDAEEDAVRRANATSYGLAAYLFTRPRPGGARGRGTRVRNGGRQRRRAGVGAGAFGGVKASGDGREGGRQGLDEYLDVQYLSINF